MDARFWDERYGSREMLFSGNPNGVLVTEAAGLPPGRALDVGCGEGGDACWLAGRGWEVTAIDISRVALERAAASCRDLAGRVTWTCADLTVTAPTVGAFDLVSLQYFPLLRQPGHSALRGLLAAVAPGGTLLIVSHDLADLPPDQDHGITPADYYQPSEVAGVLDDSWTIIASETRPRTAPAPAGTRHTHDTVLRAQRS
jgi:SAM-dependent methyltransferase